MALFNRIITQLQTIEKELQSASQDHSEAVQPQVQKLRQSIDQLDLLQDTMKQVNGDLSVSEVSDLALEVVWQRAPLKFAVIIIAEGELGPYHYQAMKGVLEPWRYLGKEHTFALSGILPRALLQRLDLDEPDYLSIGDMATAGYPAPEEFVWLDRNGSLLIVPIRTQGTTHNHGQAIGAFILGREACCAFQDVQLCEDYHGIAGHIASALFNAQVRQEMRKNIEQLMNAQLLTRAIAGVTKFDEIISTLIQTIPEVSGEADVQIILPQPFPTDSTRTPATPPPKLYCYSADVSPVPIEAMPAHGAQQLADWVMQAGQPLFYDPDDITANPERAYYNDSGRALLIPIMEKETTLGVIHIAAPQRASYFDETDVMLLRTIANCASIALRYSHQD